MIDEWRDVVGFEGLYLVRDQGEIKSVERRKTNNGGTQFVNERIRVLTPDRDGYLKVCLSKNGRHYVKSVHRLVLDMHDNAYRRVLFYGCRIKDYRNPSTEYF